jgi:hypothetical protein
MASASVGHNSPSLAGSHFCAPKTAHVKKNLNAPACDISKNQVVKTKDGKYVFLIENFLTQDGDNCWDVYDINHLELDSFTIPAETINDIMLQDINNITFQDPTQVLQFTKSTGDVDKFSCFIDESCHKNGEKYITSSLAFFNTSMHSRSNTSYYDYLKQRLDGFSAAIPGIVSPIYFPLIAHNASYFASRYSNPHERKASMKEEQRILDVIKEERIVSVKKEYNHMITPDSERAACTTVGQWSKKMAQSRASESLRIDDDDTRVKVSLGKGQYESAKHGW